MKVLSKGFSISIVLISFLIVIFAGCEGDESNKLRIGAVVDLTGYAAAFGQSTANSIELLKEKYPDVEFFVEDSKADPKVGVNAANKLLNVNKVDLIYCDLSTVSSAINPILENKGKILMATVYLKSLLMNNQFAIRNLPSAEDDCELLLDYLQSNNNQIGKVAILKSNDEFGNSAAKIMREILSNEYSGSEVVFEDIIPDVNLIRSTVTKLLATEPQVVFIGSLQPSVGNVVKELRQNGYTGEIITNNTFSYAYINQIAGDAGKGVIYQAFPKTDKFISFNKKYKELFGTEALPLAIQCYDGLSYLIDSYKKSGVKDAGEIINELHKSKYPGIYGEIFMVEREIKYPTIAKRW